jgi:hypothetical protein
MMRIASLHPSYGLPNNPNTIPRMEGRRDHTFVIEQLANGTLTAVPRF